MHSRRTHKPKTFTKDSVLSMNGAILYKVWLGRTSDHENIYLQPSFYSSFCRGFCLV